MSPDKPRNARPVTSTPAAEQTRAIIKQVETDIDLPEDFIERAFHDDDWSMVIKLCALLEAIVGKSIAVSLGRAALESFIDGLPLRGDRGKLGLAKKLGLLQDERVANFIDALAGLRNVFAHDPRNAGMTIEGYLRRLDDSKREGFRERLFMIDVGNAMLPDGVRPSDQEAARFSVLLSSVIALAQLASQIESATVFRAINAISPLEFQQAVKPAD